MKFLRDRKRATSPDLSTRHGESAALSLEDGVTNLADRMGQNGSAPVGQPLGLAFEIEPDIQALPAPSLGGDAVRNRRQTKAGRLPLRGRFRRFSWFGLLSIRPCAGTRCGLPDHGDDLRCCTRHHTTCQPPFLLLSLNRRDPTQHPTKLSLTTMSYIVV